MPNRSLLYLSLGAFLAAASPPRLRAQDYDTYCLPQIQLSLAGVSLGDSARTVRRVFGRPLRVVRDSGQDDGGVYQVLHLHYRDLLVDLGRNRVELLSTTSPRVQLPSGVRVGMTLNQVSDHLRLPNADQYLRADTLGPVSCHDGPHDPGLAGLYLIFSPLRAATLRTLVKIEMTEFGP
jgi:hypothetical protein